MVRVLVLLHQPCYPGPPHSWYATHISNISHPFVCPLLQRKELREEGLVG